MRLVCAGINTIIALVCGPKQQKLYNTRTKEEEEAVHKRMPANLNEPKQRHEEQ